MTGAKSTALTNYWLKFYRVDNHCTLCGNKGIVDSTGLATTAGFRGGRRNFCICPNGQALRHRAPEASGETGGPK